MYVTDGIIRTPFRVLLRYGNIPFSLYQVGITSLPVTVHLKEATDPVLMRISFSVIDAVGIVPTPEIDRAKCSRMDQAKFEEENL